MHRSNQNSKVRNTVTRCLQKQPHRTFGLTQVAIIAMASLVVGCNYRGKSTASFSKGDATRKASDVRGGGITKGSGGAQEGSSTTYSGNVAHREGSARSGGTGSGNENTTKEFLAKYFSANDATLLKSSGMAGDVAKLFKGETLDKVKKEQLWQKAFAVKHSDAGRATLILKLAEAGVDPNTKINDWELPVCHAISTNGYDKTFEALLNNKKTNLEATQYGQTPLCIAITENKQNKVAALLQKRAKIEVTVTDSSQTPLSLALKSGNPQIVAAVLDKNPDLNRAYDSGNILHIAARATPECAEQLLKSIPPEDMARLMNAKNDLGQTPLHCAAMSGNEPMAVALIKSKADVNARVGTEGDTPLHTAAGAGHAHVAKILVDAQAKVDVTNEFENTPLHCAVSSQKPDIVRAIAKEMADINAVNEGGDSPLHYAAHYGCPEIVKILLQSGAKTNVKNKDKHTPADLAKGEHADEIKKLLSEQQRQEGSGLIRWMKRFLPL